jgi:N-acetylmuramoyl-L-alanine amidase
MYWDQVKDLLGDRIRYRSDKSDGDHDREARFFVLTKTAMPAILGEHLFFDNLEDAKLLMDDEIVERFAEAQVRAIIQYKNR